MVAGDTYRESGEVALRAENIDKLIKNIAARKFVIKSNIATVMSTNAWENTYYRETVRELGSVDDIPRNAAFPQDNVSWEKKTDRLQKFGLESEISWEDASTNNVPIVKQTAFRIANRIALGVDRHLWNVLTESQSPDQIHEQATSATWDNATRSDRIPHEDIAKAIRLITDSELQAYMPNTLLLSPYDYTHVVTNDYVMDSFDASNPQLMQSGNLGTLLGLSTIVSPVVTADKAAVCQAKVSLTYRQAEALRTITKQEEGRHWTLRGWEIGVGQLTDPKSVCLITDTQS